MLAHYNISLIRRSVHALAELHIIVLFYSAVANAIATGLVHDCTAVDYQSFHNTRLSSERTDNSAVTEVVDAV